MKPIKDMTLQEQLEYVNRIGAHLVPNGRRAMVIYNPHTEPVTYLHPGDVGDLLDVMAGLLEQAIEEDKRLVAAFGERRGDVSMKDEPA